MLLVQEEVTCDMFVVVICVLLVHEEVTCEMFVVVMCVTGARRSNV